MLPIDSHNLFRKHNETFVLLAVTRVTGLTSQGAAQSSYCLMRIAHATCGNPGARDTKIQNKTGGRLKQVLVPIHRDGWRFIAIFAMLTVGLAFIAQPLGIVGAILTAWCTYFFRDPPRVTPVRPGLIISGADGVVQLVDEAPPPAELDMGSAPCPRVAVFMNVFDVHVNRIPAAGEVTKLAYRPGRFFDASLDKASEHNERQALRVDIGNGRQLAVVQIAGLVARRIRCDVREGQAVRAGERFGLIRFGSRVDHYLPIGTQPLVIVGQRTVAGETVIADLDSNEPQRSGEIR